MAVAIYPGTFDPITRGHEDIVVRAVALFDTVVLAVARSRSKSTLFDLEERMQIAREVFSGEARVRVIAFSGLLVDAMREQGATVAIRGVRSLSDFDYETPMAAMNRRMMPTMETIFLLPSAETAHLSGTLVREIARMGGDYTAFVPAVAAQWLSRKLAKQGEQGEHGAGND